MASLCLIAVSSDEQERIAAVLPDSLNRTFVSREGYLPSSS